VNVSGDCVPLMLAKVAAVVLIIATVWGVLVDRAMHVLDRRTRRK
jgi:hypothetical protein